MALSGEPAADVLESLGLGTGHGAVARSYEGLLDGLVIDESDSRDAAELEASGLRVGVTDTRIADPDRAETFADWLTDWWASWS